jgi:hypothetical protein
MHARACEPLNATLTSKPWDSSIIEQFSAKSASSSAIKIMCFLVWLKKFLAEGLQIECLNLRINPRTKYSAPATLQCIPADVIPELLSGFAQAAKTSDNAPDQHLIPAVTITFCRWRLRSVPRTGIRKSAAVYLSLYWIAAGQAGAMESRIDRDSCKKSRMNVEKPYNIHGF